MLKTDLCSVNAFYHCSYYAMRLGSFRFILKYGTGGVSFGSTGVVLVTLW